jgi:hypothetical protein
MCVFSTRHSEYSSHEAIPSSGEYQPRPNVRSPKTIPTGWSTMSAIDASHQAEPARPGGLSM